MAVSAAVRERLVELSDLAARAGRVELFLTALDSITHRLQNDPGGFGEEVYDLRAMRLTVRVGVILPLAVEFSIHPTERVVFVTAFRYIPSGFVPPSNGNESGAA